VPMDDTTIAQAIHVLAIPLFLPPLVRRALHDPAAIHLRLDPMAHWVMLA
jgi:hypothetical protein